MTTLQTLEMALEALETGWSVIADLCRVDHVLRYEAAIKALRTQIALEKMAENERELGIQMQPARWISLTDDEIWDVYKKVDSMQYKEFSRAIEAKLKSKNEHQ